MKVDIKGESHISASDLDEEVSMIKNNNYDYIFVEGSKESDNNDMPFVINQFYKLIFSILSVFYTDEEELKKAIENSDAEIKFTRDSNAVLFYSSPFVNYMSVLSGIMLLITSISFLWKSTLITFLSAMSFSIIFSASFLYLILGSQKENRELNIRDKIEKLPSNSTVLVIIGQRHVDGVQRGNYNIREVRDSKFRVSNILPY